MFTYLLEFLCYAWFWKFITLMQYDAGDIGVTKGVWCTLVSCQLGGLLSTSVSSGLVLRLKYSERNKSVPLQWRHNEHDGVSNHQPHNRLFGHRSKKTPKPRVTGLCDGNSPVTGEFPAQRASNAGNGFIWWRHHAMATGGHQPCASPNRDERPFHRGNTVTRRRTHYITVTS